MHKTWSIVNFSSAGTYTLWPFYIRPSKMEISSLNVQYGMTTVGSVCWTSGQPFSTYCRTSISVSSYVTIILRIPHLLFLVRCFRSLCSVCRQYTYFCPFCRLLTVGTYYTMSSRIRCNLGGAHEIGFLNIDSSGLWYWWNFLHAKRMANVSFSICG